MQVLLGDFGDRDVVDIDVLLADEVEQQIERAVVHCTDDDGERGFVRALVSVNMRSGCVSFGVRGVVGILGHCKQVYRSYSGSSTPVRPPWRANLRSE